MLTAFHPYFFRNKVEKYANINFSDHTNDSNSANEVASRGKTMSPLFLFTFIEVTVLIQVSGHHSFNSFSSSQIVLSSVHTFVYDFKKHILVLLYVCYVPECPR